MPLNLTHLAAFHAVAEAGSVTLGAERLLVSQPAVSKQVKLLEREVGAKLFDRTATGVRPTDAGRLLADYARRIFSLAAEAEAAMSDQSGLRRGSLSVGAGPTLGTYLLPRALVYFRQRFPAIRLHTEVARAHLLRAALLDGAMDMAVTNADVHWPDVEARAFMTDELVAIAPPSHPLARRRRVTPEQLCREPFVVRETGSQTQSLVERTLAGHGHALDAVLALGSTEAVKEAVAEGLGVAMVSKLAVESDVARKRLAVLRVKGLSIRRPVYLLRARGRQESKAAHAFGCILKHAGRGTLPAARNPIRCP